MLPWTRPRATGAPQLTRTPAPDDFSQMRGARDEDLDPRALRQIISESDDLAREAQDAPWIACAKTFLKPKAVA